MRRQPEQLAEPLRVLIAGGGVAGLEAVLALHDLAGDRVELTLLSPERDFVFRPSAVGSPFGRGHAERRPLADVAKTAVARVVAGELAEVDAAARCAVTATGERLEYDALLVAIGARSEAAYRSVSTWTPENDSEVFGGLLRDLEEGYVKRVAFVVPPGVGWSLPAYELALMTAWQVRGMGQDDVEVTIYTPEDAPLSMFGAAASAALRLELHEVAVRVETGVFVQEGADGLVLQPGDRPLETQRTVALPVAASRRVAGLPVDERGFIPCDLHGKVSGAEAVWAAGDAIAFPIKQGGLAAQEAGAAAEAIAAVAGCAIEPQPFEPVLRGVLLTGRGRQWMRNDLGGDQGIVTRDHADLDRRALWWPPTKVAGRYLSPVLAATTSDAPATPPGHPVDLDVGRYVAAAADALHMARLRDGENRARYALRRAEAGGEASQREMQGVIEDYDRTLIAAKVKLRREGYLPAHPARPGPPRPGRPERRTASS